MDEVSALVNIATPIPFFLLIDFYMRAFEEYDPGVILQLFCVFLVVIHYFQPGS